MQEKQVFDVTWTAQFTTRVTLEPGEVLSDAIQDINIPEDDKSSYCCDTFEVDEVRGPDGKRISDSKQDEIEGLPAVRAQYTSVFDDNIKCTSACMYDPNSMRVYDIATAENAEDAENADSRTDEYVTLPDGTELREDDDVTFDY